MTFDYDLFVIGAGSGGVRASRMAAQQGVRVAVAEQQYLGGTCVNVGCIPKKLLVYASHFQELFRTSRGYGWTLEGEEFDWRRLIANKDREIERLNGIYANLLDQAGVTLFEERATLLSPQRVAVGDREITAERILLAVGGRPRLPDIPGIEHVVTSNEAFYLDELPRRIAIVGGGYIAVEFAGIFHGLGVETHLIYRGDRILRGFDEELRGELARQMLEQGIHIHFNTQVSAIEREKGVSRLLTADGQPLASGGTALSFDQVMYATGREPNLDGLGLEHTRVRRSDSGHIMIDEFYQTDEPSIHALGDITGGLELTPVALAEAMTLVRHLYGGGSAPLDYQNIPTAVFSNPEIGTVGLTEEDARRQYPHVKVFRSQFRPLLQTLGGGTGKTLMKLVVDGDSDRVLGCHMLGDYAGEVIQGFAVALKAGATKAVFDQTIGVHPSSAEEFVTMRQPVGK